MVAALILVISAATLVFPDQRMVLEQSLMANAGLATIAAVRMVLALIFILAAPRSRAPRAVRAFGVVVLIAGLVTPWFGTERGQAIVTELVAQGRLVMRVNAIVGLGISAFLFFALRRPS